MKEMSHLACARKIEQSRGITDFESQLCTVNSESGNSLCTGSAGSFVGKIENDIQVVYGVKSFFVSSNLETPCSENAITVSTRVTSHIEWIESIVWPLGG